ncbi:MAG TPA: pentapeptide repeat-containing protein [Rhizomicrobium sp.]|nr:pentapeptide repeat-containing protein [Rhizomicrobium sp.]
MLRLALALASFAVSAQVAPAADPAAVARIHGGIVDCVGCNLEGADLSNTCVKAHDLHGADFDGANATLMCMSYANFSGATFRGTDLSGANLAHAILDGADLTAARMTITSIKGTDLTRVKGLTQSQLDAACGDAETKVPVGLAVHTCS